MYEQQNLQTLRSLIELWRDVDLRVAADVLDRVDGGLLDRIDADFEIRSPLSSVTGDPYRGLEGLRRWLGDIGEQFAVWEAREHQIRTLAEDRFLIVNSIHAQGRESGVELDWTAAELAEFSEGRLRSLMVCFAPGTLRLTAHSAAVGYLMLL